MESFLHTFTGWLRSRQLKIIAAVQALIVVLLAFDIVSWTDTQSGAIIAALTAWLALSSTQNVDARALQEWNDATNP